MPLLKLWNSFRGKSASKSTPQPSVQPVKPLPSGHPAKSPGGAPAVAAPLKNGASHEKKVSEKPAKKKRGFLGRSPSRSPLVRELKDCSATSVLEIGVGDGSRAVEVVMFLSQQSDNPIRYAGIDQFEMSGGETTLMQFHQKLRAASIRPQLFPEPTASGLLRVAHTIGMMDLVLIADDSVDCDSAKFRGLLSRVVHQGTRILRLDSVGTWSEVRIESASGLRRAA